MAFGSHSASWGKKEHQHRGEQLHRDKAIRPDVHVARDDPLLSHTAREKSAQLKGGVRNEVVAEENRNQP
jgi:hypothetical protein